MPILPLVELFLAPLEGSSHSQRLLASFALLPASINASPCVPLLSHHSLPSFPSPIPNPFAARPDSPNKHVPRTGGDTHHSSLNRPRFSPVSSRWYRVRGTTEGRLINDDDDDLIDLDNKARQGSVARVGRGCAQEKTGGRKQKARIRIAQRGNSGRTGTGTAAEGWQGRMRVVLARGGDARMKHVAWWHARRLAPLASDLVCHDGDDAQRMRLVRDPAGFIGRRG